MTGLFRKWFPGKSTKADKPASYQPLFPPKVMEPLAQQEPVSTHETVAEDRPLELDQVKPAHTSNPVPAEPRHDQWLIYFNEANLLHRQGRLVEASEAYRNCFEAGHPYPAEALSGAIICRLKNGERLTQNNISELGNFDRSYLSYLTGVDKLLNDNDPDGAIRASGNAFEAFHTGTEPDRYFLTAVYKRYHTFNHIDDIKNPYGNYGRIKVSSQPANIVFYWDKNPPDEVVQNFRYHEAMDQFAVQVYDRQSAEAFLYDYYGRECKTQFLKLRHPAEEADYLRAHLMYAYGGCYLDADLRLKSPASLVHVIPQSADAVIFLTAGMMAHNDLILCAPQSKLMNECIKVISANCAHFPGLGIALKTGPGAFMRAINRLYFRSLAFEEADPRIVVRSQSDFDRTVEPYDVTYKQDSRNWQTV